MSLSSLEAALRSTPYRINNTASSLLGRGAYGTVYAGFIESTREPVAIKRMTDVFGDLIDCKRILREMCLLSRINSRAIISLYDIIIVGSEASFSEILLVLEIADSDLKKLKNTSVVFPDLQMFTSLIYGLLVGVHYIHSAGVCHRDLKPANCLVNSDCTVKLCDFGLARPMGGVPLDPTRDHLYRSAQDQPGGNPHDISGAPQLTQHVVTRWYRAPELILKERDYSLAVDMWSVGCIVAELLTMLNGNGLVNDRPPLFPGEWSDQSPPRDHPRVRTESNQLVVILKVLGAPSENDLAFLSPQARRAVDWLIRESEADLPTQSAKQTLQQRFPATSSDCIDLVSSMLEFNPANRITAEQALSHRFFKNVQRPTVPEPTANAYIRLPFDDSDDMVEDVLRYHLLKEVKFVKQKRGLTDTIQIPVSLIPSAGA
eukprot:GHVN01059737.1.p1 GENE.GHVN01059737.1~~GHVN01059737.1.p1  ORF type:complete len:431 (+),score=66.26 GHVN01059737.1:289-1581(+)